MKKHDPAKTWSVQYRLVSQIIVSVSGDIEALGLEVKELFVLAEIDEHPHPAGLAATLCMPKPTVTVYLKRLEAAGFVRREIDPSDLRKHRLSITASGRKVLTRGLTLLSRAYGERLDRLTAAQQLAFAELLEKLTAA
jgi:DNA-binding MarR family transcriptional regulator